MSPDDHRYHGEFGFYLKDKEDPDYSESISQLSRAIDLADQQNFEGAQAWYAVNRAIARIEKGNQLGYSVPWPDQAEIMADLERAQEYGRTPARIAQAEGAIVRWQSQHQRVSR